MQGKSWEKSYLQFDKLWKPFLAKVNMAMTISVECSHNTYNFTAGAGRQEAFGCLRYHKSKLVQFISNLAMIFQT